MEATKDLGITWQCTCGKWNNGQRTTCWKCGAQEPGRVVAAKQTALDAELQQLGAHATQAQIDAVRTKYATPRPRRRATGTKHATATT